MVESKFSEVNYMLDVIRHADPEYGYLQRPDTRRLIIVADPPIVWATGRHSIWVLSKNISFMSENLWYPGHAAALVEGALDGSFPIFETPAGRVHRVSEYDVDSTQQEAANGTLEEDSMMVEPWHESELGQYKATLVDGNHRAAAAMILGKERILVTVGENYWENVNPKDWV